MFIPRTQLQRTTCPYNAKAAFQGYSLIEVLVAATVFSLGLAGFAALLLTTMIESSLARKESIAAMAAVSLAEQIRLNASSIERYLNPPENITQICTGKNICSPGEQAVFDFKLWQLELADSIPNARGLVCHDGSPTDGTQGNSHCDGTGPLVIKIFWTDRSTNKPEEPIEHRFTLEIS